MTQPKVFSPTHLAYGLTTTDSGTAEHLGTGRGYCIICFLMSNSQFVSCFPEMSLSQISWVGRGAEGTLLLIRAKHRPVLG